MGKSIYNSIDELPDLSQEPIHVTDSKTKQVTTYNSIDELPDLKKKGGSKISVTTSDNGLSDIPKAENPYSFDKVLNPNKQEGFAPLPQPVKPKDNKRSEQYLEADWATPATAAELRQGDEQGIAPIKSVATGLASVASSTLKSIAIAAKRVDFFNEYTDKKVEDLVTYRAGKWVDDTVKDLVGEATPEQQQQFGNKLFTAVGQMGGFMLGGLGGKMLKMSTALTTAALGAAVGGASEYEAAVQSGSDPDQAAKVFWINASLGTTEALPFMSMFRKMDKYTGGLATGLLAKKLSSTAGGRLTNEIAGGLVGEVTQEVGVQALSNVTAANTYDATRKWYDGLVETGGISAIIGGSMSGIAVAIRNKRAQGGLTKQEDTQLAAAEQFAQKKADEALDPNKESVTTPTAKNEKVKEIIKAKTDLEADLAHNTALPEDTKVAMQSEVAALDQNLEIAKEEVYQQELDSKEGETIQANIDKNTALIKDEFNNLSESTKALIQKQIQQDTEKLQSLNINPEVTEPSPVIEKESVVPVSTVSGVVMEKPIQEMNSAELQSHADKLREYDKQLEGRIFGKEGAKAYKDAQRRSDNSLISDEERKAAYKVIDDMESALTENQRNELFGIGLDGNGIHDYKEVRDIANTVSLVEDAENVYDLGKAIKNTLLRLKNNEKNQGTLAILNAAKKRAQELNVEPKDLIKQGLKSILKDLPENEYNDAEFLANSILDKLQSAPNETKGIQQPSQTKPIQTEVAEQSKGSGVGIEGVGIEKNDLSLQNKNQINEQVNSNRLSSEEKSGAIAGGSRNVEATNIVNSIHGTGRESEGKQQEFSQEELRDKESKALEDYAKENNIWVADPFKEFGNKPHAYGAEQNVYFNKDGTTVTKLNSASVHGDWREFFERIALHNHLFPDTKYTLKGFTDLSGDFTAILEQPFIKSERGATKAEIEADMAKNGFENVEENDYLNKETGVFVRDLHGQNVLIGQDGNLHYIDPIIELDTPDKGYTGIRKEDAIKPTTTEANKPVQPNESESKGQGTEKGVQQSPEPVSKGEPTTPTAVLEDGGGGKEPPIGKEGAKETEGDKFKDKGILNRLHQAKNIPEQSKKQFEERGLKYEPQTKQEAREIGKLMVDEYGIDDAVTLAEMNKFKGGVNSAIFGESLNRIFKEEQDAKTPESKLEAAKKYAEVSIRYDEWAREKGRDISQIDDFYKRSPLGIKIKEEARRAEAFTEFSKKKDQSWKEFFDEMVKEPEFEKEVKTKISEELKKERAEARAKRIKKVDDIFDAAIKKLNSGGATFSSFIPITPKVVQIALEGMKKAYHAGEKVAKLVEDAIDYITKESGSGWDKDSFRKEWNDKLGEHESVKEIPKDKREKILERYRKKLKGLNEKEKDEVIRKAFKKLVENGALEFDDFKKIIADTIGYGEMTTEQVVKITKLVEDINAVDDLAKAARETDRSEAALKKYQEAKLKAEKSATELGKIVFNKIDLTKRLLSIMQLNTLGIPSLINNPIFNIVNQSTVRLPKALLMTAMDYGIYGGGRLFGKDFKPENNVVVAQREFYKKMYSGAKQSVNQFLTGLTNRDYFQKEVYASQIDPIGWAKLSALSLLMPNKRIPTSPFFSNLSPHIPTFESGYLSVIFLKTDDLVSILFSICLAKSSAFDFV